MIWLASVASRHPVTLPATFRQVFHVSWFQAGTEALSWREAQVLTRAALADTTTPLGAEAAGWSYPASLPELLMLMLSAHSREVARAVSRSLPFDPDGEAKAAEAAEVEAARAELLASVRFA